LCWHVIKSFFIKISRSYFETNSITESELFAALFASNGIGFFIEFIEIIAEIAQFNHTLRSALIFFDVNAPLTDAAYGAFEDLTHAGAHVFDLLEFFRRAFGVSGVYFAARGRIGNVLEDDNIAIAEGLVIKMFGEDAMDKKIRIAPNGRSKMGIEIKSQTEMADILVE